MPSFAPCLHKEADTKIFARATEAANKEISSYAVYTAIVVMVIPVVQQLWVDELWDWQKSQAIVGVKSNCPDFFIHSQDDIKHPFSLVVENGG